MINILGLKRIMTLLALIALNAGLIASVYMYMSPELKKKERELRGLQAQTASVQGDIERMQVEFEQFKEQQVRFEEYKKDGFFVPQDRRQAEDLFREIQEKSGITAAKVAVNPAIIEESKEAEKAEYKILKSTIQVEIEALDDMDIFHYLYLVEKGFPGHITIEHVEFKREADLNGTVLRAIAGGRNVPLVKAVIELVWRTMIPESQVINGGRER